MVGLMVRGMLLSSECFCWDHNDGVLFVVFLLFVFLLHIPMVFWFLWTGVILEI
jgi:hypothetical protein